VRGRLPLSDADFANVRAAVLARIARPHRATRSMAEWGELAALAASVLIAVVSFVVARRQIVMPPASRHPVIPSVARDLAAREARRTPIQVPPLRFAQGRHDEPRKHAKPVAQLARIEIHTADPDVRIIWITHQEAP
jgi:hypothetical protein